jgi:hypothetical protein
MFVVMGGFCAAVMAIMKKRGGTLQGLLFFYRWHNVGLAIVAFNTALMLGMAVNLALFADANSTLLNADPPKFLGHSNGHAMASAATGLTFEALITTAMAALAVKCIRP